MKAVRVTIGSLLLVLAAAIRAEPALEIRDPWIREAPPTARVLAGYLILDNHGETPVIVTGASSPDFESAEIHQTLVEDGMARMLPVEELAIPANEHIALEPGGRHLMLYNPARALRHGDTTVLTIHLEDGSDITVTVPVMRQTGDPGHHHQHH